MSNRSVALYEAVCEDVKEYLPCAPVGPNKIPPDVSYKEYASVYLAYSVVRKWIPKVSKEADAASLQTFLASNKSCEDWSLTLNTEADAELWGSFLREVDDFFHPSGDVLIRSFFDILEEARVGPGAAVLAKGSSLYAKLFSSQLTVTSPYLYDIYREYIEWYPTFSEAECLRYEKLGLPRILSGSRSCFVPKTSTTSRMICVEPILNMYFQLGLGAILERRLSRSFGIDMSTQPMVNQALARIGSRDGSISTIDLSSASDSISLKFCESALPKWFFELLLALRSHTTEIDGKSVRLNMISTMGNGFTFPLQTVIFSCMIRAAYRDCGIPLRGSHRQPWSCFGDDLICLSGKPYRRLRRLLDIAGFRANDSKTFTDEDPFRESCGADWLFGQPLRPVFVKKLDTKQDLFVAINLLNEWSSYSGVPLKGTISLLLSWLRPEFRTQFVPFEEANDSGIRVPFRIARSHISLMRPNLSYSYKKDMSRRKVVTIGDGEIRLPRGLKKNWVYNPAGLYISFLFGELVNCTISVKPNATQYSTKRGCSPRWDYIPPDRLTNGINLSWQQWETAVTRNMS